VIGILIWSPQAHLGHFPTVLFDVFDHFRLDLGMIISELLLERGIMARGLAHPIAMGGFTSGETVRKQKQRWEFSDGDSQFQGDLFSMFGAVKVTPRNFYRLLQTNQTMLLFPGKNNSVVK